MASRRNLLVPLLLTALVAGIGLVGATPASAYTVSDGPVRIQSVHLNGGDSERNVLPGTLVTVTLHLSFKDSVCPTCREQIQVGFANQAPDQCVFDGATGTGGVKETVTFQETAAAVTGSYFLAFDRAFDTGCLATNPDWWNGPPDPDTQYLGRVQVKPNTLVDQQVRLTNITLNGLPDREFTLLPGAAFSVAFVLHIRDTACPACQEQLEVGFGHQQPDQCVYDGVPGPVLGSVPVAFVETAPLVPGSYFLAVDVAKDSSCLGSRSTWWNGTPDPQRQYLAHLQVKP